MGLHANLSDEVSAVGADIRRRAFLKSTLLVMASGSALLSGCMSRQAPSLGVLRSLLTRLLPVVLPSGSALYPAARVDIEGNLGRILQDMAPSVQSDLNDAATLFEYGAGVGSGHFSRFSSLDDNEALAVVESWQNGASLQRGIVTVFKKLIYLAYWRDSATWPAVEFDGPVSVKWGLPSLGNAPLPLDGDVDTEERRS